ncbi:hypothetical protein PF005_g23297 [Phytophthora fragariae]|uniref:Uncharacterized protein n=1 Tax=Phytophthora fragariae TaxID=53985 RepID=A0A6A3QNT4_9STRA|nr:hypothetical protein PF011_g21949 [Phytophthora fragariae]KAE9079296.1 hypothetical protein PF010_g22802 [Phytophthora fragariae]KAE9080066.1 hypothetical protein PF007_g23196 [Phytophthora fragariae]KAE9101771.1 hypothetical protein PF006_g22599 [Phytophthora fragariae]KAE9180385.1 hypothetical protein PF005_g23297 [Phytophthora fragariae]
MPFNTSFPSDQTSLYASTGEYISAFSHEGGDRGLAIALSQHSVERGLDVSQYSQAGDPRTSDGGLISLQLAQQAPASVLPGNSYAEYGGSSREVAPGSEPDFGGTQGEKATPRPPSKDKDSVVSAVSGDTASEETTADELTYEDFECSEALVQRDGTKVAIVLKVKGKDTKETKYTELRAFCARVGIRAYKNKSKAMLLEMIAQTRCISPFLAPRELSASIPCKALVRFTKSGTNGDDFYRLCGGRLDALYVHLHLLKRPGLTATVNQELPDEVYYESEDDPKIISDPRSKKKSDVAEAIRELVNQRESMEERKYRLLEKKETQKMEYLEQRSRTESRRAALQEYTFLHDRLRALYRQQEHETSVRIREDIDEEIAFLKSNKQKLKEEM